jgi:cytochrome o ubiquinol oxidase subunit IV
MNETHHDAANHDHYGMGEKTTSHYIIGFVLCIILTLIPFFSVIHHWYTTKTLLGILLISAVLQFFVQVKFFLSMNLRNKQGKMNVMCFVFSGVVLLVVIGGSLWIITSLNYFMM